MHKILLGSKSPRRQEILRYFHLPFEVESPDFDEVSISFDGNPENYVIAIAEGKGKSLQSQYPDHVIITADTIVMHQKRPLLKPTDEKDAMSMLKKLSGQTHHVYTAVSVHYKDQVHTEVGKTAVAFNHLTDKQIERYLQSAHGIDKAGSYGGQEIGSLLIDSIDGSFYNLIGLPVNILNRLLNQVGIDLWDYVDG